MKKFKDRVAIVTGAASGIGCALGQELARMGALVIMADIQVELLEDAVRSITQDGHTAEGARLDVTDFQSVKALVDDTAARHGTLDYIFNNAGITVGGEVRDVSIGDWRDVLDVNLFGVVNGVAAAYPVMVEQGHGHIINTASIAGLIPFPVQVSYVASKYGIVGLSNALRVEGAELGVNVSVVCPGFIRTPIFYTSKLIKINREEMLRSLPERFIMTPEECASVILHGVERNKAIIVVTRAAKVFWWLHRINPGWILWIMRRKIKEARQKMRIED
jgi:NAD(P)-dependent dehydrogenase (short-subunit alcohol dehydrogenase family)